MSYPEGSIIARNIIERPKFDSSVTYTPWELVKPVSVTDRALIFAEGAVASRPWAGDKYRLVASDATIIGGFLRVPLPKEALTRGLKVSLDYGYVTPTPEKGIAKAHLLPTAMQNRYDYTHQIYADRDRTGTNAALSYTTSAFSLIHSEVTLKPLDAMNWTYFTRDGVRLESKDWTGAHLVIEVPTSSYLNSFCLVQCRVDYMDTTVTGYFDGDTPSTKDAAYSYTFGSLPSASEMKTLVATTPPVTDPPKDPGTTTPPDSHGPTDPPKPTVPAEGVGVVDEGGNHYLARRAVAFVNHANDPEMLALANAQLPVIEAFIYGYTRGRGFKAFGTLPADPALQHVIVSAAARLLTNPEGLKQYQLGDYMERPAVLNGWTVAELSILNRYRKRSGTA